MRAFVRSCVRVFAAGLLRGRVAYLHMHMYWVWDAPSRACTPAAAAASLHPRRMGMRRAGRGR